MKRFVDFLAATVRSHPVLVILAALTITVALGAAGGLAGRDDGNEAFAPDAEELTAFDELGVLFGEGSDESSVQIIISTDGGNAISPAGLEAVAAAQSAVLASATEIDTGETVAMSDLLSRDPSRPDFISYLQPIQQGIEDGSISATLTGEEFRAIYADVYEDLPEEERSFLPGLLSEGSDPAGGTAERGLALFFFNQGDLTDDQLTEVVAGMAEDVVAAAPSGATIEVFTFGLLFADQDEFQQETGRLFMFAGLIIVTILLFVFWVSPRGRQTRLRSLRRSAADMGLTIATIFMSIGWMFGVGALLGPGGLDLINDPNPMTDIVPILIIGLGVDYSIHLGSRYKEQLAAGEDVSSALGTGIKTVGIALALATITTAVGFLTNIVNPVPALVVFGVYASLGIAAAFILMLTFVPAVRLLLDRRAERGDRLPAEALGANKERLLPRLIGRLSWLAEKVPVATVTVAFVLGALGIWGATQLETRFSVTDFVPEDNIALGALETLEADFGGGLGETTSVVVRGDLATTESHNTLLAAVAATGDTPDVVQFGGEPAVESVFSVLAGLTNPDSPVFDEQFAATAAGLGLSEDLSVAPGSDVAALYNAAAAVPDSGLSSVLTSDYDAALFSITTQAGEQRAGELRDALNEDFLAAEASGLDAVATSDNIITKVVAEALESSQLSSLVITIVAAMALLVINFWMESRRPFLGVITILPVVLVVLWVFGLMTATDIPFGPVTATIAAIAIGIGVPYTIHVAHRYQEDRVRYATPEQAISSTTTNTGGALAGSAFTTAAGFGILMTSTTVPFQQFGQVSVYAILGALVAAVMVLPSLLILWDRWHRARGEEPVDRARVEQILDGHGNLPAELGEYPVPEGTPVRD